MTVMVVLSHQLINEAMMNYRQLRGKAKMLSPGVRSAINRRASEQRPINRATHHPKAQLIGRSYVARSIYRRVGTGGSQG